jgi:hypothetical protein
MDFLDFLNNVCNVTNNSNLIKIHFERFTDKHEYKGERVKSFFAFIVMVLCFTALIFGIVFLIYKTINRL